jgi:hypothetical protein
MTPFFSAPTAEPKNVCRQGGFRKSASPKTMKHRPQERQTSKAPKLPWNVFCFLFVWCDVLTCVAWTPRKCQFDLTINTKQIHRQDLHQGFAL